VSATGPRTMWDESPSPGARSAAVSSRPMLRRPAVPFVTHRRRPTRARLAGRANQGVRMTRSRSRVGYQGEEGAFSEEAVYLLFPGAEAVPFRGFRPIFSEVESRGLDLGVVPVENSTAGSINETFDLLAHGT